jgi:hypothetical protein
MQTATNSGTMQKIVPYLFCFTCLSLLYDFSPLTGTSSLYSLIASSRPCVIRIKQEWCGFVKRVVSNGGGWAMGKIIAEASTNTKQMPCWGRVCYVFAMELTMSAPKIFSAMFTSSIVTGQFLIAFILINVLNVSIIGVPTM